MERIKGIRQKTGAGQYSNFVPFGSDGQLIDMASELNLEYELKLGPRHITKIINTDNSDNEIIEGYYYKGSFFDSDDFLSEKDYPALGKEGEYLPGGTFITKDTPLGGLYEIMHYGLSQPGALSRRQIVNISTLATSIWERRFILPMDVNTYDSTYNYDWSGFWGTGNLNTIIRTPAPTAQKIIGEENKIYKDLSTNSFYMWNNSQFQFFPNIQIIEYYTTPEELEINGSNFYSVETLIYNNNTIKIKLYWVSTSLQDDEIIYNKNFIKGKTITIEEQSSSQGSNTNFNIIETYFDEEE